MNQTILPSGKTKTWRRRIFTALALVVIAPLAYFSYLHYSSNLHPIIDGEAYRSGQMNAGQLAHTIQSYGVKSIVNLRGTNNAFWPGEMETAAKAGVQHYDFALSANAEVSLPQMEEIIQTLRLAPKPVLIHCQAGADRTGLVSALYRLTLKGETPAEADRELSVWYGHIPLTGTIAMDHSFWSYASNFAAHAASP
jgi:protein tyrosine/serine phosphatase